MEGEVAFVLTGGILLLRSVASHAHIKEHEAPTHRD
jgi:hypothetical protein